MFGLSQREIDKQIEEDYPGWDRFAKPQPGPYKIVWDTQTPTSHTRLGQKEIWIRSEDTGKPDVLAHEIAHSRLLSGTKTLMDRDESEDVISSWQELEAVLYTIAKGQASFLDTLIIVMHDASETFGDGSLREAKRVAIQVLKRMEGRGHITKSERSLAASKVNRISRSKFESI